MRRHTFLFSGIFSFCVFVMFLSGCAESGKPGVSAEQEPMVTPEKAPQPKEAEISDADEPAEVILEQKFSPGDVSNYRIVNEATRRVDFSGSMKNKLDLRGGQTGTKVELTFSREIESVDEQGNAVIKITINGLKYFFEERSVTKIDYDSSREKDKDRAFAKLIGKSYRIKVTPSGELIKILDADSVRRSVMDASQESRRAAALLREETIEQRHEIPALSATGEKQLKPGSHWSQIKDLSFGMMGEKTYEKMYTLKGIDQMHGQRIATVEMEAIPAAESAQEAQKQNMNPSLTRLFDNIEDYTGQLKLNLDTGNVVKYTEKMQSRWVMVDPEAAQEGTENPDTLTMQAVRLHQVDKLD